MADFQPDMTWSWASPPVTTPSQPQNRTLPTWGAVGSPNDPYANYNPAAPVSMARKAVGYAGLGGLAGLGDMTDDYYARLDAYRTTHPVLYYSGLALSAGTAIACSYHGYKRHRGSVAWAIGWFLCGSLFPIITLPLAFFEGYAKPAR